MPPAMECDISLLPGVGVYADEIERRVERSPEYSLLAGLAAHLRREKDESRGPRPGVDVDQSRELGAD